MSFPIHIQNMHICPRWTRYITDVTTRNRRTHLNTSRSSHSNYTTLAERFLGASVSVFKGCVTLWGGRWPMNICIYIYIPIIYINVFLETRSNPTLLPILFTLPGPPQFTKKNEYAPIFPAYIYILCQLNQSTSHFCRRGCIKNYKEGQLFDRFGLGYKTTS